MEVQAKQNMTFTCKLSKAISAGTITIDYSLDNKTWITAGHGEIKNGRYTLNWAPPNLGKYYIRVAWVGDQNFVEIPVKTLVITVK